MYSFCFLTSRPIEVRLILSSWFCKPKLPATSTTIWRQVQGIVGRKSVTTNCRHWKAVRIKDSLEETTYTCAFRDATLSNSAFLYLICVHKCQFCQSVMGVTALFFFSYSYPWSFRMAPMTPKTRGQPGPRPSPWLWRICRTLSSCFCRMSAWSTLDNSFRGLSSISCSRLGINTKKKKKSLFTDKKTPTKYTKCASQPLKIRLQELLFLRQ